MEHDRDQFEPEDLGYMIVHRTLWNPATDMGYFDDDAALLELNDDLHRRRLVGTIFASPFHGRDPKGTERCFFCFPDLLLQSLGSIGSGSAFLHLVQG